ncbi:MAG: PD40 domain-containing protein [Anaerolineae bacterium]|nr:PD40 domain-containing protein [Anaerolineae bacterium]
MLTNHFRRFFVLFVVVGLMTAVLSIVTAVIAQPTTSPPAPNERALLPHLATGEADAGVGSAILYPPDWSKGVFQSYRDGNWEIYSSQPPHRLTNHGSSDMHPRYNRGATHIVFSSNRDGDYEIFVMNADGSGLQQLTHNGANDVNPVWSPDGSQIAFQSYRDGQAEVYVMDANGLNERRLTAHGSYDGEPTWSPDGSQLAFTSAWTGTPYIYVMNSDGTGISQRSSQPSVYPAWSPDGSQIAYSGDQDGDGWLELWLMNADGSNQHMLYDPYEVQADAWARGWSPDGREITFTDIKFIQYQGNWYWEWAYIISYDLLNSWPASMDLTGLDWHPDWQTTDVTPPVSELESLPAFSQPPDFRIYWSGTDQESGAGLATYDVQYKVGSSGPWVDWQMGVTETSAAYTAVPGTTVSFRARARDNALNVVNWPAVEAQTTTFYTWSFGGKVTDNRGMPIAQTPLSISPLPLNEAITDDNGDFFSRLKTEGSHTLDVNRAGYGDLASTSLNMENLAHIYLPPANNALLNGGFEAATPLDDWTTTGTVTAVTNPHHTGTKAVRLGNTNCSDPCLTTGEETNFNVIQPDIAADSQGILHLVKVDDLGHVIYTNRSTTGVWSTTHTISSNSGEHPMLAVDPNDDLHVSWTSNHQVFYSHKSAGNSWSTPVVVATLADNSIVTNLVADSQGGLHALIETLVGYQPGANYLYRQPDSIWQAPIHLTMPELPLNYRNGVMAIGPDDSLHFIWGQRQFSTSPPTVELIYQQRFSDGTWSSKASAPIAENLYDIVLHNATVDVDGSLHVAWTGTILDTLDVTMHAIRLANGSWSGLTLFNQGDDNRILDLDLSGDSYGNIHAVFITSYSYNYFYRLWRPGSGWQSSVLLGNQAWYDLAPRTTVDPYDLVHILAPDQNGIYFRSLPAASNNTAVLSQQVTIPADMPAPTLAFMAQRPGDLPGDASGLELLVSDGVTTTAVPLANGGAAWAHYWADMSPWAGQTVTVDFRLTQVSGDPRVQAAIDDVTLGSSYPDTWVWGVGPGSALPGETVVLTLEYGNNGRVPAADGELVMGWSEALTFVSASVTPTVGVDTLTWELGELAAEAAPVTIVVTATVDAATPFWEVIDLPVSLSSATAEVEQQNNEVVISLLVAYRQLLPMLARP